MDQVHNNIVEKTKYFYGAFLFFFSFFFIFKTVLLWSWDVQWYGIIPLYEELEAKKTLSNFWLFFPISFCVFYFCAVLKSDTHFRGWCAILRWVDWSGPLTTHAYGVHLQDLLLVRCMVIRYIEDNIYVSWKQIRDFGCTRTVRVVLSLSICHG